MTLLRQEAFEGLDRLTPDQREAYAELLLALREEYGRTIGQLLRLSSYVTRQPRAEQSFDTPNDDLTNRVVAMERRIMDEELQGSTKQELDTRFGFLTQHAENMRDIRAINDETEQRSRLESMNQALLYTASAELHSETVGIEVVNSNILHRMVFLNLLDEEDSRRIQESVPVFSIAQLLELYTVSVNAYRRQDTRVASKFNHLMKTLLSFQVTADKKLELYNMLLLRLAMVRMMDEEMAKKIDEDLAAPLPGLRITKKLIDDLTADNGPEMNQALLKERLEILLMIRTNINRSAEASDRNINDTLELLGGHTIKEYEDHIIDRLQLLLRQVPTNIANLEELSDGVINLGILAHIMSNYYPKLDSESRHGAQKIHRSTGFFKLLKETFNELNNAVMNVIVNTHNSLHATEDARSVLMGLNPAIVESYLGHFRGIHGAIGGGSSDQVKKLLQRTIFTLKVLKQEMRQEDILQSTTEVSREEVTTQLEKLRDHFGQSVGAMRSQVSTEREKLSNEWEYLIDGITRGSRVLHQDHFLAQRLGLYRIHASLEADLGAENNEELEEHVKKAVLVVMYEFDDGKQFRVAMNNKGQMQLLQGEERLTLEEALADDELEDILSFMTIGVYDHYVTLASRMRERTSRMEGLTSIVASHNLFEGYYQAIDGATSPLFTDLATIFRNKNLFADNLGDIFGSSTVRTNLEDDIDTVAHTITRLAIHMDEHEFEPGEVGRVERDLCNTLLRFLNYVAVEEERLLEHADENEDALKALKKVYDRTISLPGERQEMTRNIEQAMSLLLKDITVEKYVEEGLLEEGDIERIQGITSLMIDHFPTYGTGNSRESYYRRIRGVIISHGGEHIDDYLDFLRRVFALHVDLHSQYTNQDPEKEQVQDLTAKNAAIWAIIRFMAHAGQLTRLVSSNKAATMQSLGRDDTVEQSRYQATPDRIRFFAEVMECMGTGVDIDLLYEGGRVDNFSLNEAMEPHYFIEALANKNYEPDGNQWWLDQDDAFNNKNEDKRYYIDRIANEELRGQIRTMANGLLEEAGGMNDYRQTIKEDPHFRHEAVSYERLYTELSTIAGRHCLPVEDILNACVELVLHMLAKTAQNRGLSTWNTVKYDGTHGMNLFGLTVESLRD